MKSYEQIKKETNDALTELVMFAGSKSRLARALNVSPQVVQGWQNRGRISATMAIQAEIVTAGAFTKEYLRPDVQQWIGETVE